jgi:hypothetical protein
MKWISMMLAFTTVACTESKDMTVDLVSDSLPDRHARIVKLREYFKIRPGLDDAKYHIVVHDNRQRAIAVPGPSDYFYLLALKIDPDSISHWTAGSDTCSTMPVLSTWSSLNLDSAAWNLKGDASYYCNGQIQKIVYKKEGILLYYYSAQ